MKKLAVFGIVVLMIGLALGPAALINANGVVNGGEDNDMLTVNKTLDCVEEVDGNADGIINLGEVWDFGILIVVQNNSSDNITGIVVQDRLGAEFMFSPDYPVPLIPPTTTGPASLDWYVKGNSHKLFLTWTVGDLGPGESAKLKFVVRTDENPGGHQEFTSPDTYCLNSGATAKGRVEWVDPRGRLRTRQVSAESNQICIVVPGSPTPVAD